MDCLFCSVREKRTDVFYENEDFFAHYDRYPISPGHAHVIPKRHIISFFDLNNTEWKLLKPTLDETVGLIEVADLRTLYTSFAQDPLDEKSKAFSEEMLGHIGITKSPDGYNLGINDGKAAGRTIDHLHIHIIPRYFGDMLDPRGGIRHMLPGKGYYL